MPPNDRLEVADRLRFALQRHPGLSDGRSSLFLDVEEIYGDFLELQRIVEAAVLASKPMTRRQAEDFLVSIDVLLLEHSAYHLRRLRRSMSRAVSFGPSRKVEPRKPAKLVKSKASKNR